MDHRDFASAYACAELVDAPANEFANTWSRFSHVSSSSSTSSSLPRSTKESSASVWNVPDVAPTLVEHHAEMHAI